MNHWRKMPSHKLLSHLKHYEEQDTEHDQFLEKGSKCNMKEKNCRKAAAFFKSLRPPTLEKLAFKIECDNKVKPSFSFAMRMTKNSNF